MHMTEITGTPFRLLVYSSIIQTPVLSNPITFKVLERFVG